ncbi:MULTISPECIES: GNAT family N-acetyltransferase [Bacillus amyloliquefaciens group]|uniref:GNAT family N-acetyltransferase n=1 Tax=Bacillus amyloliquefaciens group TaxID=1938374 RepID=UPI0010A460CF|nr:MULTISPECIES: GNAT family protein [Bacillus amyloliquefaciens group]MCR4366744.1 GNAT family N-acetyltransferase [Bacillus amyloliquefaciens]MCV3201886.1 GNAT family N-acetyltransferase [Bacillus velezensis]MDP1500911.1 GNAT family protein [Bacillus velezensis]MDP1504770.1 GNAT family protein [Bacillus velezensis]MDW0355835.1 GNAT family N-acetyltransferase [Bacillus velezensis]
MLTPVILRGSLVQLEPMTIDHTQALCDAASENRTTYAYTHVPDGIEETKRYIERALSDYEKRLALPFAVRSLETDRIVGSTRFMDAEVFTRPADAAPEVCEIGSTWYASAVQRTGVNTECKLLMLTHAFDVWQAVRVTLKTDVRNQRSRTAILRIGAQFEGIRRAHIPAVEGGLRDTAYYSILREEWPYIRQNLSGRLKAYN